jgi:ankyrin repeat protein
MGQSCDCCYLGAAIMRKDVDMVRKICKSNRKLVIKNEHTLCSASPLHVAVKPSFYNFEIIKLLVEKDNTLIESVDNNYDTPLHYAICYQQFDAVKLFIESNERVLSIYDKSDMSPIFYSIAVSNIIAVKQILSVSRNQIHARRIYDGKTPLHMAVDLKNTAMIELLIGAGASVNNTDDEGKTPLHSAIRNCDSSSVELLVRFGGDVDTENNRCITPVITAFYASNRGLDYVKMFRLVIALSNLELYDHNVIKNTEEDVLDVRYRVHFSHPLIYRLLIHCQ